jgi:hypothetical protein
MSAIKLTCGRTGDTLVLLCFLRMLGKFLLIIAEVSNVGSVVVTSLVVLLGTAPLSSAARS